MELCSPHYRALQDETPGVRGAPGPPAGRRPAIPAPLCRYLRYAADCAHLAALERDPRHRALLQRELHDWLDLVGRSPA